MTQKKVASVLSDPGDSGIFGSSGGGPGPHVQGPAVSVTTALHHGEGCLCNYS